MGYEVLARKWRPQQFEDVVGQEHVTDTLKNAITIGRTAHAYLFVGPRGTGKTTLARIFAKALNCESGPTPTPCGTCECCTEITAGNNLDVLEIDGASNNGVDQVRDLRETVMYTPVRGNFKIYIIDEVHMLTTAAFNALLKTLEEPPPHVKFIFATTEPQKIPATILSRCQRFDLRRILTTLIVERLSFIAKEEGVSISDDAVLAIARGSEGGLRDAQSALDQLISFKGDAVSEDDVLSVFGMISRETLELLAGAVLEGDIPTIIEIVAELDAAGKDVQRLVIELLEHFRHLLVCLSVTSKSIGGDLTDAQVEVLRAQAERTHIDRVLRVADILVEVDSQLRYALSKRTLLETGLIRAARAATVVTLEEILVKLNGLDLSALSVGADSSPAVPAPIAAPAAPAPAEVLTRSATRAPAPRAERAPVVDGGAPADSAPPPAPPQKRSAPAPQDPARDLAILRREWPKIVERVCRIALGARSAMVDAHPIGVDANHVVIGLDAENGDCVDTLRAPRVNAGLRSSFSDLLERKVTVEVQVVEGGLASALEAADAAEPPPAEPVEDTAAGSPEKKNWREDPIVKTVIDKFGAEFIEARD